MVMVLLGIRKLTHYEDFEDAEETFNLKREVKEDGHIISNNNIFSSLVEVKGEEPKSDKSNYKSNSSDPLSRIE